MVRNTIFSVAATLGVALLVLVSGTAQAEASVRNGANSINQQVGSRLGQQVGSRLGQSVGSRINQLAGGQEIGTRSLPILITGTETHGFVPTIAGSEVSGGIVGDCG